MIGAQGKIPWHLPADFEYFKKMTMGHPVVMGRKTFDSIGKPLAGRTNIVVTKSEETIPGALVAHSLDDALRLAAARSGGGEIFVIGGAQIYALALPKARTIYLTKIHGKFNGDTFFPRFDEREWRLVSSEAHKKDERNPYDYDFLVYERR